MSEALELPFLGKRKEIGYEFADEEAIFGKSKKATLVENKGVVGDDKEKEGKKGGCDICSSKKHTCRQCPWNVRIPPEINFVPVVGANWMVVCKNCGNKKNFSDDTMACPECGYQARYVAQKKCCACKSVGHLGMDDTACKYNGVTEEENPFRKLVERMLERTKGFEIV